MCRKRRVNASTPSPDPEGASRDSRTRMSLYPRGRSMTRNRAVVSSRLSWASLPRCCMPTWSLSERSATAMAKHCAHSSTRALNESEEKKMEQELRTERERELHGVHPVHIDGTRRAIQVDRVAMRRIARPPAARVLKPRQAARVRI
eukprot:scaffold7282_cov113-Isochrysis_galbana.AAC.6